MNAYFLNKATNTTASVDNSTIPWVDDFIIPSVDNSTIAQGVTPISPQGITIKFPKEITQRFLQWSHDPPTPILWGAHHPWFPWWLQKAHLSSVLAISGNIYGFVPSMTRRIRITWRNTSVSKTAVSRLSRIGQVPSPRRSATSS